jgi:DNA-binding beta-propeller fold protein YncE
VGVAITSSGTKAFVATTSPVVTPIDLANNTPQPSINVGDISTTIAITPDNQTAYVTVGANAVVPIDVASNTAGAPIFVGNGPYGIAITPDQTPVAIFSAAPDASNGLTILFDASNSVSPVGTIVTYGWNFGDGTIVNTDTPTITHTYAAQGSFDVTLTVVNSAGTSDFPLFTGQTVSNNGGPNALLSRTIEVSATLAEPILPSANLRGRQIKNGFSTKKDFVNILTWEAPIAGAVPVSYRIYRDSKLTKLIGVVRANKKLRFEDHDRQKGKSYTYFIVSVDQSHRRSTPASITVAPKKNDE